VWVLWIIVLSVVVGLMVFYSNRSREAPSAPARAARAALPPIGGQAGTNVALDELGAFVTALREGSVEFDASVVANPPIALKNGESLAVVCYEVILREARSMQQGVYGGPRLRMAKNLSFNLGGFRAAPHEELRDVDSGDLVLTSRRMVFLGEKCTINVDLSQIVGVEPYLDAVAIHRANKQHTEMFCNLNRQQMAFSADGRRMTLISGLVAACAIERLIARNEAAPPPAEPRASTAGAEVARPRAPRTSSRSSRSFAQAAT